MTTTETETETETESGSSTRRPVFRGRRFWASVLAGVVLIVATFVAAQIEAPNPSDDRFLSPGSSDDVGASILAEELAAEGVEVEHHTNALEGIQAAGSGDVTIFVTAPDYLKQEELYGLGSLRFSNVTVVLVRPPQSMLNELGLRTDGAARLATDAVESDCAAPPVSGVVQVGRQAYRPGDENASPGDVGFCFDGYLATVADREFSAFVVGSGDPFSNQWINEVDNRQFATELLNNHDRLIWLDVHALAAEPPPPSPEQSPPEYDDTYEPEPVEIPYPDSIGTNPIYDAMPSWMWAGLVGLLLLMVLAALWRGRRLGPPVVEPLPVSVPAAETVHGRAMLYRRAGAHPQALRALRAGALHRIRPVVGLSTQSPQSDVVTAVTERIGRPHEWVDKVLFTAQAENERQLMELSKALDQLVSAIEDSEPQGRVE